MTKQKRVGGDYFTRHVDQIKTPHVTAEMIRTVQRLINDNCDDPDTVLAALGIQQEDT